MIVLVPMAGAGSRFAEAGYRTPKPLIPVTSPRTGQRVPMVVAAVQDLPVRPDRVVFVIRDQHRELGICDAVEAHYPEAVFVESDRLTEGQACTCLLAEPHIISDDELLVASCDNGMLASDAGFDEARRQHDALIFTYRGHPCVQDNPEAYGWVCHEAGQVRHVSVKKPISKNPLGDHAVVGAFWFRRGGDFVKAANAHLECGDRINGEFYVDQVMNHAVGMGLSVGVFEVDRYLGWGTPTDYENYERTWRYWRDFLDKEPVFMGEGAE